MTATTLRLEMIRNPILPGFHPDPSIVRVGEDYYIATSTFEWFPGVRIHHSRDLVHWRTLKPPLTRPSQLEMRGNPNSGGIWAPCLSHDGKCFYLIYTDVKNWGEVGVFKDTHNYLVTATDIEGEWSEPVYLNSSGFDPSLFHDTDGKKWLVNMQWDHRTGKNPFSGILLQEYDPAQKKLIGKSKNIFAGTPLGLVEGPHLYTHNGWYYLLTAEGGTGYQHAVSLARSKTLDGDYEVHPHNPILTSSEHPELEIQKAGHASLVQTQHDQWYLAHLGGRTIAPDCRYCPLGRETSLQAVEWREDGWLYTSHGSNTPLAALPAPKLLAHPWAATTEHDHFDQPSLGLEWQSLRVPIDPSWLRLDVRPSWLRLYGRESLQSLHQQSLIGRRLQHFEATASTKLEFNPKHFQQMAGLVVFYDTLHWTYLRVSSDEVLGKCLNILACDANRYSQLLPHDIGIANYAEIHLRVEFARKNYWFSYSSDGSSWQELGPAMPLERLSDDYCNGLAFTGTFIGLCVQDLSGTRLHADFDEFRYHPSPTSRE
jgi:xylan 1,4-beta-xylosidase